MFDDSYEPYVEKKRERRIRDKERVFQKHKRIIQRTWCVYDNHWPGAERYLERMSRHKKHSLHIDARRAAAAPTPCSCVTCGNPRRHYKGRLREQLTVQERRAFQTEE